MFSMRIGPPKESLLAKMAWQSWVVKLFLLLVAYLKTQNFITTFLPKALEIVSLVTSYANTLCHKPGMYLELISVAKMQFTENSRPAYML